MQDNGELLPWKLKDVSRETKDKLYAYASLVEKWNKKINLVSKKDVQKLTKRHIEDSLQILQYAEIKESWTDLGSGGGFPAIPAAIVHRCYGVGTQFSLIESDARKCAFLKTVSRELELDVTVIAGRIEKVDPMKAAIVSARALASLSQLFQFLHRHMRKDGFALLPKGQKWREEVEMCRREWQFELEHCNSVLDIEAAVLKVKEIQRLK